MILAEGDFWTWMNRVTDKFFDPTFWVALGSFLTLCYKMHRDWSVPTELKKNTDATTENKEAINQVLPAIAVKVDSANKKSEETLEKSEKVVENMAGKVAVYVTKELRDKAEINAKEVKDAAKIVAQTAREGQEKINQAVEKVSKAIHGDDGSCLTGKVKEHGERLTKMDERLTNVEQAVTEGLDILREMKKDRSEVDH